MGTTAQGHQFVLVAETVDGPWYVCTIRCTCDIAQQTFRSAASALAARETARRSWLLHLGRVAAAGAGASRSSTFAGSRSATLVDASRSRWATVVLVLASLVLLAVVVGCVLTLVDLPG